MAKALMAESGPRRTAAPKAALASLRLAPWGLAMAPAGFGRFSGDLLVGNFADGHVNAYEEMANGHFVFRGFLLNPDGTPLAIDGLWALEFGNGAPNNGPVNTLFFTAGPNDESDGLFGTIMAA